MVLSSCTRLQRDKVYIIKYETKNLSMTSCCLRMLTEAGRSRTSNAALDDRVHQERHEDVAEPAGNRMSM